MREPQISDLMHALKVPGVSFCITEPGASTTGVFGTKALGSNDLVGVTTIFEAASLSKPIVAYAALRLADAGELNLDEPLARGIGPLIPNDPAASLISARHVLSHTTGLPNWRRDDTPLRTYFEPGSRFSYSGEGFVFLQRAIEKLTGEPLDAVVERLVFGPLGMHSSSFVWRDAFEGNAAFAHLPDGSVEPKFRPQEANAAFSLHTTAVDYSQFVAATMDGRHLSEAISRSWLSSHSHPPIGRAEDIGETASSLYPGVAWGLGWGLEPATSTFFHWGSNLGATAFAFGVPETHSSIVVFANSNSGLNLVPHLIDELFPGDHPSLGWLGLPFTA